MSITYKNYTDSRDGTVYPCVQMPDGKWWFTKNLSYASANSHIYNNDSANEAIYGRLYPWADLSNACPSGCHIPTDAEWTVLTTAIGESVAGTKLKANSALWSMNTGTDDYGFAALPAGSRGWDGTFYGLGGYATFWSSSELDASNAWNRDFGNGNAYVDRNYGNKADGFSLRFVVDVFEPAPIIVPVSGTFVSSQIVTITATTGASIYYTLDGTTPTTASTLYSGAITVGTASAIGTAITVSAIAVSSGETSAVSASVYTKIPAAPTISTASGTYIGPQQITITADTGLSVYYTTDATDPTGSSLQYSVPFTVSTSCTIKAIAIGAASSLIAASVLTIRAVTDPVAAPDTSTFTTAPQVITLSDTDTSAYGAEIHYTLDGTTPDRTSTLYVSPLSISANTTVKFAAFVGSNRSNVKTAVYTFNATTPTFSPVAGTFSSAQQISLSTVTVGASIYYTVDGSTPTTASNSYAGPITVSENAVVQAISVRAGWTTSAVSSATYSIQASAPTFSPAASGSYVGSTVVTITTASTGASIYYTVDGSTPTTASNSYTGGIVLTVSSVIKAIAVKSTLVTSTVAVTAYTITEAPQADLLVYNFKLGYSTVDSKILSDLPN